MNIDLGILLFTIMTSEVFVLFSCISDAKGEGGPDPGTKFGMGFVSRIMYIFIFCQSDSGF